MPSYQPLRLNNVEWFEFTAPAVNMDMYGGSGHITIPGRKLFIANRYPRFADGSPVGGMTHAQTADYISWHNREHPLPDGGALEFLPLYADEGLRNSFGIEHDIIAENIRKNGLPQRWGFVIDFTKSHGYKMIKGIGGQECVLRDAYWRHPKHGDLCLGLVTIVPDGMVPQFTKKEILERYGDDAIDILRKSSVTIPDDENAVINPIDGLGYAQFTLGHNARVGVSLINHNTHYLRPDNNYTETVGARLAYLLHASAHWCFGVGLGVDPEASGPRGSFPLVRRGEKVVMTVERDGYKGEFEI